MKPGCCHSDAASYVGPEGSVSMATVAFMYHMMGAGY